MVSRVSSGARATRRASRKWGRRRVPPPVLETDRARSSVTKDKGEGRAKRPLSESGGAGAAAKPAAAPRGRPRKVAAGGASSEARQTAARDVRPPAQRAQARGKRAARESE